MRAYRFPLGVVARVRALEERVEKERFALATRDLRLLEASKRRAYDELVALETPVELVRAGSILWSSEQSARQGALIDDRRGLVDEALLRRDEAQRRWAEATKRASVLARLREHGLARWREAALAEEIAEMDNLTNARHRWVSVR